MSKYALTDQIRRSSRSVCSNLSESWQKRRYIAVFVNKLTDSLQEASETQTWLDFTLSCRYCSQEEYTQLNTNYEQIIAQLLTMIRKANSFCKL
ncbi:MAG: four helix bundle protein [Bacteroidales bacterium]|nr:four helix bundle protein [Bacteroidota bacterium]MBL6950172.1 four helix bundle protein [Bacteroidales bacterium]